MADDIDIEEHDVLDSLRLRQPAIKSEPADDDERQYEEHQNNYYHNQWEWEAHTVDTTQIKVETPETEEEFQFGKIILGSKPSRPSQDQQADGTEDNHISYNYNMSLVLEDWGPILQASSCYCPECEILFATVNALDAHKMIAHSFLVATDKEPSPERNKAIKSTAKPNDSRPTCEICDQQFSGTKAQQKYSLKKHYLNMHRVDPSDTEAMMKLKNWKICNHCNVYFPSDTDLVKHLYELLPLNDKTPTKDDKTKKSPVKVPSAVKANLSESLKVPVVTPKTFDRNVPVKTAATSSSNVVKSVKAKNNIVKDIKPMLPNVIKQTNSIILGSKANTKVDVKMETSLNRSDTEIKCEVCGIVYSPKYYTIHMRKFHLDFYLAKLAKIKKTPPPPNTDRFKCKLCNRILTGKLVAKQHRAAKHPDAGNRKILMKLVNKLKGKPQPKVLPKNEATADDIVVSKSTLFKCNRCSNHFLTCYGACAHSRVCESSSNLRYWLCPQCQRVFKVADKNAHQFQHATNNAKFKVYVVYLEMVVRILCECPFCFVCFEEYKFWRHINAGCDKAVESFYCNECRLPVDATSRASHESKHTQGDFTKEDFIKIDFVSSKKEGEMKVEVKSEEEIPRPALKRKLPEPEIEPKKKRSYHRDNFHLYYCSICKCYMNSRMPYHKEGKCIELTKNVGKKVRTSCKICTISFTSKGLLSHNQLHKAHPNMVLSNLHFTRIADDKKIKPHPENYPCKKCHVNFVTTFNRRRHECGSVKSFNCQVCQRKIEKDGQKTHMRFHTYGTVTKPAPPKSSKVQPNAKTIKRPLKIPTNSSSEKLPEILMKYQSLTTLWDILYLCVTCDTFTDSYDKVVEHSQNHLTNMENYGVIIMKCQLCMMKFDSECYRRHLELHAGSKDISKKSFKILKYDHSKLFSNDWLNFFDLPEERKSQILNRSIYGDMRSVRMRLVQQGPPEYTIYRCVQCQKCVAKHTLLHHILLQNCTKANKIPCSYCNFILSTKQALEEHEELHTDKNLGEDSFRIVEFNDSNDAEFYKKVMPEKTSKVAALDATTEVSDSGRETMFSVDNVREIRGQKFYMFYKCARCNVSTHTKKYAFKHVCSLSPKHTCPKCGLTFGRNLHFHNKLHASYNFSENNVFTKAFNTHLSNTKNLPAEKKETNGEKSKSIPNKEEAKLYKCHCGLHYTSLKTLEKHYQMKNCGEVVRDKCSQCHLVFDPIEVVNHLCKHHAQLRCERFNIIMPNKKTLYKCNQCHVLFYDEETATGHSGQCDGSAGMKCDQCGLAFHKSSITTHKEDHKNNGKLRPDCYIVTNITAAPAETHDNTLYKCKECDIHFVTWHSLKNHFTRHSHIVAVPKKCPKCDLVFPIISLKKHLKYHHGAQNFARFKFEYYNVGDKEPSYKKKVASVHGSEEKEATDEEEVDDIEDTEPVSENEVFSCIKCNLKFTEEDSLARHNQDRCSKELSETCDVCGVKYASRNFKQHLKEHGRQKPEVKNEITTNIQLRESDKTLYKCRQCSLHFNVKSTIEKHILRRSCASKYPCVKCDVCDIVFTSHSSNRHKILHETYQLKKDDFQIIALPSLDDSSQNASSVADEVQSQASNNDTIASLDSSFELDPNTSKTGKHEKVKLYKCGDCNVYFLTQRTCYKHTIKHKCLDLKDFIECKLCGYQFTIMALQTHIKKHHATEFNLEEVLVEEYQPNVLENNVPKIEIYYAIEQDQSRLVSTTTDVKNVPTDLETPASTDILDDNGSSEVTSNCNELTVDAKLPFSEVEYLEEDLIAAAETTASND